MVGGEIGPPWWDDKPVLLIGGGPSLRDFDFGRLDAIAGYRVGVNQAMFDLPVMAGITIDLRFIRERFDALVAFAAQQSLYVALHARHAITVPGAIHLQPESDVGLSENCRCLRDGGTSGYAALNLAVLKRARDIRLFGYDYGRAGDRSHYHDAYPWHRWQDQDWARWAAAFDAAAERTRRLGIGVINACVHSAITAFPRCSIDAVLSGANNARDW